MNTLHQHSTKRIKTITTISCALGVALFTSSVFAVQTQGYWSAKTLNGVNILNPNTGNLFNWTSPEYNADVFCDLQGNGLRLPMVSEMNIAFKDKLSLTANNTPTNGIASTRRVGSLWSEWGPQTSAPFAATAYWVAEIYNTSFRHAFIQLSGSLGNDYTNSKKDVMCVRTL